MSKSVLYLQYGYGLITDSSHHVFSYMSKKSDLRLIKYRGDMRARQYLETLKTEPDLGALVLDGAGWLSKGFRDYYTNEIPRFIFDIQKEISVPLLVLTRNSFRISNSEAIMKESGIKYVPFKIVSNDIYYMACGENTHAYRSVNPSEIGESIYLWAEYLLSPTRRFGTTIETTPFSHQSIVGIISYFQQIVKHLFPNEQIEIAINQTNNKVSITIASPSEVTEEVIKAWETYGTIVKKEAPPESLFSDRVEIEKLKIMLEMKELELKQATRLLELSKEQYRDEVRNYNNVITTLSSSNNMLSVSLNGICEKNNLDVHLSNALRLIEKFIETPNEAEKSDLENSIELVAKQSPQLLTDLKLWCINATSSTGGSIILEMIRRMGLM